VVFGLKLGYLIKTLYPQRHKIVCQSDLTHQIIPITSSMRTPIKSLSLVAASLLALSTSANAVTSTQYATNLSLVPYTDYGYSLFQAFDSNLGTLNSVTFSVDSVTIGGSLSFSQGSSGNSSVTGFTSDVTLYAGNPGSGSYNGIAFDQTSSPATTLSVTNPSLPIAVARNGSRTFTFANNQEIINSNFSAVLSQYADFADFIHNGSAYAPTFWLNLAISTNGTIQGNPSYNYSGVISNANLSLTYDYTPASPVPEPSTYGLALGSLALVAGVVARRRKLKS
jgi:hypothetical protein